MGSEYTQLLTVLRAQLRPFGAFKPRVATFAQNRDCSLSPYEIHAVWIARNLCWTDKRVVLFQGLMTLTERLNAKLAGRYCLWLAGSFVSIKDDPSDIDFSVIWSSKTTNTAKSELEEIVNRIDVPKSVLYIDRSQPGEEQRKKDRMDLCSWVSQHRDWSAKPYREDISGYIMLPAPSPTTIGLVMKILANPAWRLGPRDG